MLVMLCNDLYKLIPPPEGLVSSGERERSFIIMSTVTIIIIIINREVTASVYDLMGHPGGERERSEAAEQHITRRADLLFQVINMVMTTMEEQYRPKSYVLQRLDLDSDGVVSLEEFLTTCQQVAPSNFSQFWSRTPQFLPRTQFWLQLSSNFLFRTPSSASLSRCFSNTNFAAIIIHMYCHHDIMMSVMVLHSISLHHYIIIIVIIVIITIRDDTYQNAGPWHMLP